MTQGIKEIVIGLTARGAAMNEARFVRRAVGAFAQQLRDAKGSIELFSGIAAAEEALSGHLAACMQPGEILEGRSGHFDVCDLRHWLALSERAGVPFIPAQEILSLHESEVSSLMRPIRPPSVITSAIGRRLRKIVGEAAGAEAREDARPDRSAVIEKIFAAGDLIPPGHVVRSAICGPNTMKALAGTGTLSSSDDFARFGEAGIDVGCGWVREGNRTRIDVTDSRLLELQMRGHEDTFRYLVRPWVDAARRNEGEDIHMRGTPLGGLRSWPAEWRVYIRNGEVAGVGNYYSWAGDATPAAARGALAARDAAQRIIEAARGAEVLPVSSDHFLLARTLTGDRQGAHPAALAQAMMVMEEFPLEEIHCTLDFIETADGEVTLLEGGPGHLPIGGGHPTAFSGCRVMEGNGGYCDIRGVAFNLAEGVNIAEPESWSIQPADHALDFHAVMELAGADRAPAP